MVGKNSEGSCLYMVVVLVGVLAGAGARATTAPCLQRQHPFPDAGTPPDSLLFTVIAVYSCC